MISNLPSKEKFDAYVKLGLVKTQTHSMFPLTIYNYTIFTNYERLWNTVTKLARGIVFDNKGRCIVRCMTKFFNEDEPYALVDKPQCETIYYEKLDGSLIQIVNDEEYGLIITSKGSFSSKQVAWAKDIITEEGYIQSDFVLGRTYIFELLHPKNRIVLDYNNVKKLTLITVINNESGVEYNIAKSDYSKFKKIGVIKDVKSYMNRKDVEGLVAKTGMHRYKLKTGEYIRLHRIITDFTPRRVWEAMQSGDSLEFENMPEEFTNWLNSTIEDLRLQYKNIEKQIEESYVFTKNMSNKDIGLSDLKWKNQVFSIRNNQDYSESIWKIIKPKNNNRMEI